MILNECYKRLISRAQCGVSPRRANILMPKHLLKLIKKYELSLQLISAGESFPAVDD